MERFKKQILNIDWWEVSYLIIFGLILSFEFYHTTLLNLVFPWPPKTGLILMGASAVYTFAKLLFYKAYSKKEIVFSVIIILAFLLPAVLTQYRFLFWIGFLIVGAKDVEFKKLLKLYVGIAITLMIAAFSASQYGIIEDLQFIAYRGEEEFVRHSFGIQYPTDFAAHMFYLTIAAIVLLNEKLNLLSKIWISLLVIINIYLTANALTSVLCLLVFVVLCIVARFFENNMIVIEKGLRWTPVICAGTYLGFAGLFTEESEFFVKLNEIFTKRLAFGKFALVGYKIKLFGQDVYEKGHGNALDPDAFYYFIDDSYLKILIEYGLVAFIITLLILILISKKAAESKYYILVIALVAIAIHSVMEHHLINIAYNPMIFALFATLNKEQIVRRN